MRDIPEILQLIEKEISELSYGEYPKNLFEPIEYIMSLGGKRLRPTLGLLSYQLSGGEVDSVVRPILALEIFHNFTLMHDDIMDNAPIRRGRPTVHEKWDETVAILSGDTMLVKAYDFLLESNSSNLKTVIARFNRTAVEVCMGQQIDMNFEKEDIVEESDYIEMIRLKTAVLLGYSMELGALLGGLSIEKASALFEIGQNLGIGFQLMDDYLDVYADASKFGKQVGGDIISNKKTYLLINALKKAEGKLAEELNNWLKKEKFDSEEKVRAVTEIYDELKIPEMTRKKIDQYFDLGITQLDNFDGNQSSKELLKQYAVKLMNREK